MTKADTPEAMEAAVAFAMAFAACELEPGEQFEFWCRRTGRKIPWMEPAEMNTGPQVWWCLQHRECYSENHWKLGGPDTGFQPCSSDRTKVERQRCASCGKATPCLCTVEVSPKGPQRSDQFAGFRRISIDPMTFAGHSAEREPGEEG